MLTELSRYNDQLGHVNLHRAILEQQRKQPVSIEDAAADWYDNVYRPAVTLIRKYGVLDRVPKRTEADLYLWLIDHLHEVNQNPVQEDSTARTFSDALVDFLSERRMPVPKELLTETDRTVEIPRVVLDSLARHNVDAEAPSNGHTSNGHSENGHTSNGHASS